MVKRVSSVMGILLLLGGCSSSGGAKSGSEGIAGSNSSGGSAGSGSGGIGGAGGGPTTCYDVANDFAPAGVNPGGVWSYGWSSSLGTVFTLYTDFSVNATNLTGSVGIAFWCLGTPVTDPCAFLNPTSADAHPGNTLTLGPGDFALHPGPNGQYSIARWTAPSSGRYSIEATFTGISGYAGTALTTTDVHVEQDGLDLSAGSGYINIGGAGNSFAFSSTVDVVAGDTVDFAVGRGNGNYNSDSTGVAARICK